MDGGIYDNQGIESLMLADQDTNLRRLAERLRSNVVDDIPTVGTAELPSPPDLFIVSDADRREESIYPVGKNRPDARKRPGSRDASEPRRARLPLWGLIGAVLLLSGISLAAGFIAVSRLLDDQVMAQASPSDMLLYASALLFAFPIAGGLLWAVMRLKQTVGAIPQARADAWRAFLAVHIDPLLQTLKARWRSAVATFQGVMPLRTRNLGYWIFYSDPRFEGRRLSNRIYDLQTDTRNGAGQGQSGTEDAADLRTAWSRAALGPAQLLHRQGRHHGHRVLVGRPSGRSRCSLSAGRRHHLLQSDETPAASTWQ